MLTLITVPTFYTILDDWLSFIGKMGRKVSDKIASRDPEAKAAEVGLKSSNVYQQAPVRKYSTEPSDGEPG